MPDLALLITIGIMLILLGFLMVAYGMVSSVESGGEGYPTEKEKVKGGGVILIGPLPIVFGSDKRFAIVVMVLAIVIMLLAIILLNR